jgi:hypothetical protein
MVDYEDKLITKTFKFGILYCAPNQTSEDQMYNNGESIASKIVSGLLIKSSLLEHGSPALDEFLDLLGERVRMLGFEHFRGGLDTKSKKNSFRHLNPDIDLLLWSPSL